MDFVHLKPEQRQSFAEDGFLVVPNALSTEAVERLVEASDRLAAPLLNKPEMTGRPEYNHLDLRPGLLKEDALFDLVANSSTVPLLQLLSPNPPAFAHRILGDLNLRRLRPSDVGWHRDTHSAGLGPIFAAGGYQDPLLFDGLSKPNSGMTLMARGSHLKHTTGGARRVRYPADAEVCDLTLNAGDAFLFENRIYHTATPNRSDRVSKVLMYGYSYRWMKPEVYLEVPDKRQLAKTDPVTRQLLGEYRDVDTQAWALQRWAKRHGVLPETVPWTVEV